MRATLLILLLLTGTALALPQGSLVGTVESEVAGQVGVFRCQSGPMHGLKPGDVVAVVRDGAVTLGEASVLRAEPNLVISLKGVFECAPGDYLVYLREARGPQAAPPVRTPLPSPSPSGEAAAAPAPATAPAPAPEESVASPEAMADLEKWLKELDTRLALYVKPTVKGKARSPLQDLQEQAERRARQKRYMEAASIYNQLGASLQKEAQRTLSSNDMRAREAWSLGLEALELRALCLLLADEPPRARAAFEALARTNPPGRLAASRSLSTVRMRANVYLERLREPSP